MLIAKEHNNEHKDMSQQHCIKPLCMPGHDGHAIAVENKQKANVPFL